MFKVPFMLICLVVSLFGSFCLFECLFGLFIRLLAGRLVCWLVGRLVGWMVRWWLG